MSNIYLLYSKIQNNLQLVIKILYYKKLIHNLINMSVKTNIDKKAIINELNRRETEKTVSFEYAYEK
ncbi:MAG: hypothetical protein Q8S84_07250 [bacterium]|nr:hypothetical protein [bacterium]MDP3381251.1 hypothetical protein [bacterium]